MCMVLLPLYIILSTVTANLILPGVSTKPEPNHISAHWKGYYEEMGKFLTVSFQKFNTSKCHVIIWDQELSMATEYMDYCSDRGSCASNYFLRYEGGNFTDKFDWSMRKARDDRCGAYIFLLSKKESVLKLLHYGDQYRRISARGKFLIWYGEMDETFESNSVWRKFPNVIFFHGQASSLNQITFRIMSLRWPWPPGDDGTNSLETSRLSIIDFWGHGRLHRNTEWYIRKTTNLRNITLRIIAVEHPPFVVKFTKDNETEYAGSEIEIIKELSSIMNFNYQIIDEDPNTKWGGIVTRNGTNYYTGAIASLYHGEVDIGIGSFIILRDNLAWIDMSIPLDIACTSFLTSNPLPRPRYLALILPFQFETWFLVTSITLVFAPLGMYLWAKIPIFSNSELRYYSRGDEVVLTSLSVITQVSVDYWPKFWSMRMLVVWYWMYSLLIITAYRGSMQSLLSKPLYYTPIGNLEELANSGLRVGGWGPLLKDLFEHLARSETFEMEAAKQYLSSIYEILENYNEALGLVNERQFAFFDNIRYLRFVQRTRYLTWNGLPSMHIMKQCVLPVQIGTAFEKNSPIVPVIDSYIRRFQESGLMKKWSSRLVSKTRKYYKEQLQDAEDDGDEEGENSYNADPLHVLSISDLQGAFLLLILGSTMSLTAFIAELVVVKTHAHLQNVHRHIYSVPLPMRQGRIARMNPVSRLIAKAWILKTRRDYHSTLRQMGVLPSRWRQVNYILPSWRRRERLFPYIE